MKIYHTNVVFPDSSKIYTYATTVQYTVGDLVRHTGSGAYKGKIGKVIKSFYVYDFNGKVGYENLELVQEDMFGDVEQQPKDDAEVDDIINATCLQTKSTKTLNYTVTMNVSQSHALTMALATYVSVGTEFGDENLTAAAAIFSKIASTTKAVLDLEDKTFSITVDEIEAECIKSAIAYAMKFYTIYDTLEENYSALQVASQLDDYELHKDLSNYVYVNFIKPSK